MTGPLGRAGLRRRRAQSASALVNGTVLEPYIPLAPLQLRPACLSTTLPAPKSRLANLRSFEDAFSDTNASWGQARLHPLDGVGWVAARRKRGNIVVLAVGCREAFCSLQVLGKEALEVDPEDIVKARVVLRVTRGMMWTVFSQSRLKLFRSLRPSRAVICGAVGPSTSSRGLGGASAWGFQRSI